MIAHLRLNPLEGLTEKLEIGHTYKFQKREPLWIPKDINVELDDRNNRPIAIVKITDFETRIRPKRGFNGITTGHHKVIKLYYEN